MIELNLEAAQNLLGYGTCSSYLLNALSKKARVNLFQIGPIELTHPKLHQAVQQSLANSLTANPNSSTVKIWHQHSLLSHVGLSTYYGYPIFELDNFSSHELLNLNFTDELIVCSEWAKQVVNNYINKQVYVVPLGVDTEIFYPTTHNDGPYKFFNIGKTEIRKGHDVLIECFNRAFSQDDNVELHMMWDNPFLPPEKTREWVNLYKNSSLGDKVFFHNRVGSHEEVANFIRSMDCGLFPARAEGFNLEALETLACGKPLIITNYSAHTEYCTEENSYLVDIDTTERAFDGIWFDGNVGNWAYIGNKQKEQIVDHMRVCYEQDYRTNSRGLETAKKLSWENSADRLLQILK